MTKQCIPEPIAVIGVGCRFPGNSSSPSQLWDLLKDPVDLSKRIPDDRFNPTTFFNIDGEHHGTTNVDKGYFLEENIREFDTSFFNIAPKEAETIDPQHRILLETVYDGLQDSGYSLQDLQGSSTSVYVGCMTMDYYDMQYRDPQLSSQYVATGTASSILSNRVSYFYNWSGPSMTIDTACSSSLVAVHLAVQSLRSGESTLACAAGANLILGPERFIAQSSLHMLSPTGKSRMWDEGADGYARGEGIACVFLKKLSDALADGDTIEGIIRETGVNSDGRSKGITMPSSEAQAQLIRETYGRVGLNPLLQSERCQYFECHGTGTQAGDPREANAISSSFFGETEAVGDPQKLIVGSIKTIIGHTEGAAGLAGLIKVLLAMKHGVIPPNQHLVKLNPSVEPFFGHLSIPTSCVPWPDTHGGPMRASINSFGFGGTNAHAVVESFSSSPRVELNASIEQASIVTQQPLTNAEYIKMTPLFLTAMTEKTLKANARLFLQFLQTTDPNDTDMARILWTLRHRRSHLPVRMSVLGTDRKQLIASLERRLSSTSDIGVRSKNTSQNTVKILGIFTGQGAQWATMALALLNASSEHAKLFTGTMKRLQEYLNELSDPPNWNIIDELSALGPASRLDEAVISQPLCTCIQIGLVDLLHRNGIRFHTVVGHSSGEIAAAYAAGYLSERDALCIAYYRGVHAGLARSPTGDKGGMLAVGLGLDEARAFCTQSQYSGRLSVAASNSSTSCTLSGDSEAVQAALAQCVEQNLFARALKVDTAYHSKHMYVCSQPYLDSLGACNIQVMQPAAQNTPLWFSSVTGTTGIPSVESLRGKYWRDNMCQPVLFAEAVMNACLQNQSFDLAIEVGPHPALKGPVLQTIKAVHESIPPYVSTLERGKDDMTVFAELLAFAWRNLGGDAVDLKSSKGFLQGDMAITPFRELPGYCWDHSQEYWRAFRVNRQFLNRQTLPHELLGIRTNDDTENGMRWRNILKPDEIPWLHGHRFQGQIIVPAAAYCVMAYEAASVMAGKERIQMIELKDVQIISAITMTNDSSGVEIVVDLKTTSKHSVATGVLEAEFTLQSNQVESDRPLKTNVSMHVSVTLGEPDTMVLPSRPTSEPELRDIDVDSFYTYMKEIGLEYSGPFRSINTARRRHNMSHMTMLEKHPDDTTELSVSPALLDSCLQAGFIAFSAPGDLALWTSFLPLSIENIRFNVANCGVQSKPHHMDMLDVEAYVTRFDSTNGKEAAKITSDIHVFNAAGEMTIQLEGVVVGSFSKGSLEDDRELYLKTIWQSDDFSVLPSASGLASEQRSRMKILDNIAGTIFRKIRSRAVSDQASEAARYLSHVSNQVNVSNQSPVQFDSASVDGSPEHRLLQITGANLNSIWQDQHIPEIDSMLLNRYFTQGIVGDWAAIQLQNALLHITHRHARVNILEISNGFGSFVDEVSAKLGRKFGSYTACAPSVESLASHQALRDPRVQACPFNFDESFFDQGLQEHSYDIVIVNDFLHASASPNLALRNLRGLMRPGGFLILLDFTRRSIHAALITCALTHLWPEESIRNRFGRDNTVSMLDKYLVEASLSGVEHIACETGVDSALPASLIISRAVDDLTLKLQDPLGSREYETSPGALLVIGGCRLHTARLARKIMSRLSFWEAGVVQVESLEEVEPALLQNIDAALCLSDLDINVLEELTAQRLSGMQSLFSTVKSILWITSGAHDSNPYHSATIGMGRAIWGEQAELHLQFADIDEPMHNANLIAELLLQLKIVTSDEYTISKPLWTTERELIYRHGQLLIPRLLPDHERNERLNSQRRVIKSAINMRDCVVELRQNDTHTDAQSFMVVQGPLVTSLNYTQGQNSWIKARFSSATPLISKNNSRLFLVYGQLVASGEDVFAFSSINASMILARTEHLHPLSTSLSAENFSQMVVGTMRQALNDLNWKAGVALFEPTGNSSTLIDNYCTLKKIPILKLTRDRAMVASDKSYTYLNLRTMSKRTAKMILMRCANVVDFSLSCELMNSTLAAELGTRCQHISDIRLNMTSRSRTPAWLMQTVLSSLQKDALSIHPLSINQVLQSPANDIFASIDWSRDQLIEHEVQSAGTRLVLPSEKVYLLVGLTGELGESITRYMFEHGARHFTISSRRPSQNIEWVRELNTQGANIMVRAMDVSIKTDVERIRDEMLASKITIGGVINGAMVLSDGLFENMSLESFQTAMRPKVEGSAILDQVFNMPDLDLFIFLSSLSSVVGNPGQSNYAAANMYMVGLAAQRRKHGLAASCLDIGMMIGIGFVRRSGQEATIYGNLRRQGYLVESEIDFLESFAEAIIASREPDSHIITGLDRLPLDQSSRYKWYSEPKFSHHSMDGVVKAVGGQAAIEDSLLQRIGATTTLESAASIIQDALVAQVEVMLGLGLGSLDSGSPLIEIGIDSLVAVELRTWVFKETGQDLPVLEIMGDGSVATIAKRLAPGAKVLADESSGSAAATNDSIKAASAPITIPVLAPQRDDDTTPLNAASITSSSSITTAGSSSSTDDGATSISEPDRVAPDDEVDYVKPSVLDSTPTHWHELLFDRVGGISYAQQRFWQPETLQETRADYNVTIAYRLRGTISKSQLERAIGMTIARHSIFRTSFSQRNGNETYQQAIAHHSRFWMDSDKCRADPVVIENRIRLVAERLLSIGNGDTLHAEILEHDDDSYTLVFVYHNIIMDGMSWGVFMDDITTLYTNPDAQRPVSGQCIDAVAAQNVWLQGGEAQQRRKFWASEFHGARSSLPIFPMARVDTRDETAHPPGVIERAQYAGPSLAAAVKQCAAKHQVSSFHFHLSAIRVVITHLLKCHDYNIGIIDAGRSDLHHVSTVGLFTDYLPLRFINDSATKFDELLTDTKAKVYTALGNALPFEVIKQEVLSEDALTQHTEHPIFQVLVNYRMGALRKISLGNVELELDTVHESKLPFDLMVTIDEDASDDRLGITVAMRDYMFDKEGLKEFMGLYLQVLEVYSRDSSWSVGHLGVA